MYSAIINSPPTTLSGSITNVDTTINVVDGSRLPVAPNLATIGGEDNAETILYATRTGNTLSGITRGFQGTAQAWGIGTPVARMFTAYDYDTLRNHMATANSHVASTSNPHSVTTGQIGAAAASHAHGNITNAGAIGSAANLPIITGASGVLVASSFGTIANTFCQGNDTRLSDARTPVAHNQDASTITTGTLAVARGGTGIASYTTNNYIRAQSATVLEQRTPAQVLADISAAPATHSHVIRYNQLA